MIFYVCIWIYNPFGDHITIQKNESISNVVVGLFIFWLLLLQLFIQCNKKQVIQNDWQLTFEIESKLCQLGICFYQSEQTTGNFIIIFELLQSKMSFGFQINQAYPNFNSSSQYLPVYYNFTNLAPLITDLNSSFQLYSNCWQNSHLQTSCDISALLASSEPKLTHDIPKILKVSSITHKKRKIQKSFEKAILSAKKNSQSNIINQFYSFFGTRQKSERIVERCLFMMGKSTNETQKILSYFYTIIHFINIRRGRKYVNAASFLRLFTGEELREELTEMRSKVVDVDFLSMDELSEIIRRCAKYFLKEVSIQAILTSKRITLISKKEHLKKHRKVLRTALGY